MHSYYTTLILTSQMLNHVPGLATSIQIITVTSLPPFEEARSELGHRFTHISREGGCSVSSMSILHQSEVSGWSTGSPSSQGQSPGSCLRH